MSSDKTRIGTTKHKTHTNCVLFEVHFSWNAQDYSLLPSSHVGGLFLSKNKAADYGDFIYLTDKGCRTFIYFAKVQQLRFVQLHAVNVVKSVD